MEKLTSASSSPLDAPNGGAAESTPKPAGRSQSEFRQILGVRFFVGSAERAVELGSQGGLVVVPAAPALVELERDADYAQALLRSDLAITDSGYMVLLWNLMMHDRISRVSGLEYLHLLLQRPELKRPGSSLWIMPSEQARQRNLAWLAQQGYPVTDRDCYVAPQYSQSGVIDPALVNLIEERRPRHVIIGVGGGTQEKLGLYLKDNCSSRPSVHCIGAAIGFLTGDQVKIPMWADRWILGWFFRCLASPRKFVPRYLRAVRMGGILWRYRTQMPQLLQSPAVGKPSRPAPTPRTGVSR